MDWKALGAKAKKASTLYRLLVGLIFAGIVLIIVGGFLHDVWYVGVLFTEIGVAAVVAGLLGLTVDHYLKKGLIADVFREAFGYILHKDLRPELNWIYSLGVLCTNFDLEITVTAVDEQEDIVSVKAVLRRTFRNVSNKGQEPLLTLAVDEWGFPDHPSEIADMGYEIGAGGKGSKEFSVTTDGVMLRGELTPSVTLEPDESLSVWATITQTTRASGEFVFFFRTATKNPVLRVRLPDDMEHDVVYATNEDSRWTEQGKGNYHHHGTFLPMQAVRVRYWPTEKVTL